MTNSTFLFQIPPDLQEYAVPDHEFLRQHPEYDTLCTGVVVFDKEGKMLLVQRAKSEKAFPNAWEIPGGKVDDTDETILHAAARELQEEAGLGAIRVVRKVAQLTFLDGRPGREQKTWLKLAFEMEVDNIDVTLDPTEHQSFLYATEEEVIAGVVGDIKMAYMSPQSKAVKLEAFRLRREALALQDAR